MRVGNVRRLDFRDLQNSQNVNISVKDFTFICSHLYSMLRNDDEDEGNEYKVAFEWHRD